MSAYGTWRRVFPKRSLGSRGDAVQTTLLGLVIGELAASALASMRAIKRALDPLDIMNPARSSI